MAKAVFCIATTYEQAETIVDNLKQSGFLNNNISVLLPDNEGTRETLHTKRTPKLRKAR
jgi:hypothetical protein